MRDYETMRHILAVTANAGYDLAYSDFKPGAGLDDGRLEAELTRLERDELIDADVNFTKKFGERSQCSVRGLTVEGREFYNLIANDGVWAIILATLKKANVDISYPLLKEVCEEIVKRYVASFIPDIKPGK